MRQTVFVEKVEGNQAIVVGERVSSCGSCAGKGSCNTLGSWKEGSGSGRALRLSVENSLGAKLGDEVVIEVADTLLLKTAFKLYAIPMVIFMAVGGLVWRWALWWNDATGDTAAALCGILGIILYYVWIWKQGTPEDFAAKIIEIKCDKA